MAIIVPLIIWLIITIIPSVRLLRRTGVPMSLATLNLIPGLGTLILIWIIAFSNWPRVQRVAISH
jgi:hypothetical protein